MPDVDCFEKTLRGPYWRKAYRLSFTDDNSVVFRDTVTRACAAYLREAFPADCLKRCPQIIFDSLKQKAVKQSAADGPGVFLGLNRQLEQFDSEDHDFAAMEIMKTAAQAVFNDLESHCKSVTSSGVEQSFSKELIGRVLRHCFLARAREGIAKQRSQSAAQQVDWETDLIADISTRAEPMLRSFFRKQDGAIRAPKRLAPQRRMTMDELNKGLPTIEA
jgi:hypothetical protein